MSDQILCKVIELPSAGEAREVKSGGRSFCVVNSAGKIHVLDNKCLHDDSTSLSNGTVCSDRILCPRHGWAFNLETGQVPHLLSRGVKVYSTDINQDEVRILEMES
jgi:nitrite reductase/ring-hydroxylating ferredoxin subunit